MHTKNSHTKWWSLYLPLTLVLSLFVVEARAHLTSAGHRAAEIGLVLLLYGIVWLWINANERGLFEEERQKTRQVLRRALEPLREPDNLEGKPEIQRNGDHSGEEPSSMKRESAWINPVLYDRAEPKN
jgi:hypothetical protein